MKKESKKINEFNEENSFTLPSRIITSEISRLIIIGILKRNLSSLLKNAPQKTKHINVSTNETKYSIIQ